MSEETHPILDFSNQTVEAVFQRALRNTLILGLVAAVVVGIASGWRDGAMLATGTLISAASIFEWQRLVRLINARLDHQKTPTSAGAVVVFFVLRLTVFAGVIYGSLKCFQGSVTALLCGLGLAALAIGWEAIRMLRD
jgi:uncharacterized membrane protein